MAALLDLLLDRAAGRSDATTNRSICANAAAAAGLLGGRGGVARLLVGHDAIADDLLMSLVDLLR